jgi:hypothetical protein
VACDIIGWLSTARCSAIRDQDTETPWRQECKCSAGAFACEMHPHSSYA